MITSAPAVVQVREHMAIATQPYGGGATEGTSFTFAVATNGGGYTPLTYAWRKEGSSIVIGTEASLTLGPLTPDDIGTYYVTVSDDLTDVEESTHVELQVNASLLPVAGVTGLSVLAGAFAVAALRIIRRRK
jgi:hypothetical protein